MSAEKADNHPGNTLCSVCEGEVDTREVEDGGTPDGCDIGNGDWVCGRDCYNTFLMREHAPNGLGS